MGKPPGATAPEAAVLVPAAAPVEGVPTGTGVPPGVAVPPGVPVVPEAAPVEGVPAGTGVPPGVVVPPGVPPPPEGFVPEGALPSFFFLSRKWKLTAWSLTERARRMRAEG